MDLHGGNIYRLEREGIDNILDYSSNINPLGVPNTFKMSVLENFSVLEKYPDPEYIDLRKSIAHYNDISLENVIVGNGATEILFLYMKSLKAKKIMIVAPTFAEYERAARISGKEIEYFPLEKIEDFNLNIEKLLESIGECEAVVLCNPNNPTGKFIDLEKIDKLSEELEKKQKKLFIDEAFIEFVDDWEKKTAVNLKRKNIFILRALTKFFALPGVRLGYGITLDKDSLKSMEEKREPWSVNSFAELAGKVMLQDSEYIEATEKWISEEKRWFYSELNKIEKIKPYETESNFILIELLEDTAQKFREKMIQEGILVRDASNFKFLNESYIRLAIKDRERNEKVLEKIKKVVM